MTQLVLLKRSDANLVLVTCCDHMEQAMALAAELSKMQAFSVAVLASLPTLGRFKDEIHEALAALHIQNRWYAAGPGEVLQIASIFFDARPRLPPARSELENAVASQREPQKEMTAFGAGTCAQREACEAVASLPAHAQVIESVACPIHTAALAATQESSQDDGFESDSKLQGNDESDQSKLLDDDADAAASKDRQNPGDLGALLVPCDKCEAGAASSITEALRKKLGKEAAAALLKQYKQAVMRGSAGKNTRYWVNCAGQTVKLADGVADSGEAERNWQPNLALELNYDDLSDASSLDGHESPAHKQVKEYAQSRRAARATLADAQESEGVFFVGPRAKF
jgi:hypothetical protein